MGRRLSDSIKLAGIGYSNDTARTVRDKEDPIWNGSQQHRRQPPPGPGTHGRARCSRPRSARWRTGATGQRDDHFAKKQNRTAAVVPGVRSGGAARLLQELAPLSHQRLGGRAVLLHRGARDPAGEDALSGPIRAKGAHPLPVLRPGGADLGRELPGCVCVGGPLPGSVSLHQHPNRRPVGAGRPMAPVPAATGAGPLYRHQPGLLPRQQRGGAVPAGDRSVPEAGPDGHPGGSAPL